MADTPKRPKLESFMTPKGMAIYPKLNTPDTKFKAAGEYAVKVKLSEEDSLPMIEKIEALIAEEHAKEVAKLLATGKGTDKAKVKSLKFADKPYKAVVDDDGEETGEYTFNIKMAASYVDKKTGQTKQLKPRIFAAKGKAELKDVPAIWSGSVLKVAGEYNPFATAIGIGCSLRLSAVQIIELRNGAAKDADAFGFGEEEGYEADSESDFDTVVAGDGDTSIEANPQF